MAQLNGVDEVLNKRDMMSLKQKKWYINQYDGSKDSILRQKNEKVWSTVLV